MIPWLRLTVDLATDALRGRLYADLRASQSALAVNQMDSLARLKLALPIQYPAAGSMRLPCHLKHDHALGRNFLKGKQGDRMNALLTACGFNLRKLYRCCLDAAGTFALA